MGCRVTIVPRCRSGSAMAARKTSCHEKTHDNTLRSGNCRRRLCWPRLRTLGRNTEFLVGVEAEVTGLRGLDPDRLHCFLDARMMPGYIGWAFIGVGGIAQVGLACRRPTRPDLDAFMKRLGRVCDIDDAKLVGRRGGLIPVGGRVEPLCRGHVTLVGDAAGLVSPFAA